MIKSPQLRAFYLRDRVNLILPQSNIRYIPLALQLATSDIPLSYTPGDLDRCNLWSNLPPQQRSISSYS